MNLSKLRRFGELQDRVFELTGGAFPLVSFYDSENGISVRNPFMDVSSRFEVDPVKEYGEENLSVMEERIGEIETEMGLSVEEMDADDLRLYLGGKFYLGKEPSLECFEKIFFEDEPIFQKSENESPIDDELNFYIPLFDGFEELFPEAALALVTPRDDGVQVNTYLNYDITGKDISLLWTCNNEDTPELFESGNIDIPEAAKEKLLAKLASYVKEWGEESLEALVSEAVNENIWLALETTVKEEWYVQPNENGYYSIEISADYRETNEGLLETAYNNRDSADLKNIIIDSIDDNYQDAVWAYESELLDKAGFGVDSPYHEQAREMMYERISFSPDHAHFMQDDMKINLLLATDWERNVEFTDIKDNLARWIDKEAFAEMQADAKKYGNELRKPDNGLMWLIKQQGYSLEALAKAKEAYDQFNEEFRASGDYGSYSKAYEEFTKTQSSPFLISVCSELDNQSYSMGCITVLLKTSLEEYCELFERNAESKELVPKEIVIPKGAMLGIHNPWDGSGSVLEIELEKDLVLPNTMIFDTEIEGVKRDYGWTVDEISGLVGSCWKESRGVRESEGQKGTASLDDMICQANVEKESSSIRNLRDKDFNKEIDR